MIPYYIAADGPTGMFIVPALLFLGWRLFSRRILPTATVVLRFAFRVQTHIAYASGQPGSSMTRIAVPQ